VELARKGYSGAVTESRPGIASANRPRLGPFVSLLEQVPRDPSALDGLAFAYGELADAERRALVQAVVQDTNDPARALLALIAVEEEPRLRRRIASLIQRHTRIERSAVLEGTETEGESRLIQSVAGLGSESLHLVWKSSKIGLIEIEPRTVSNIGGSSVPVATAVDSLLPLLWRHIRAGGELPEGAERFAGFFSAI
jgi:hypothetical protein